MNSERNLPPNPESQRAEAFLNEIYGQVSNWLRMSRNARVISEFGPQKVEGWKTQDTGSSSAHDSSMDLKRAIVLRDERDAYGIAFGRRRRSSFDSKDYLSLQFGFSPPLDRPLNELDELKHLVVPSRHDFKKAEFYYDGQKLWTDCWMDESRYGGSDINAWEYSAITGKGQSAVVGTIKRLVRNYDPV